MTDPKLPYILTEFEADVKSSGGYTLDVDCDRVRMTIAEVERLRQEVKRSEDACRAHVCLGSHESSEEVKQLREAGHRAVALLDDAPSLKTDEAVREALELLDAALAGTPSPRDEEVERLREVLGECVAEMTKHAADCPKSDNYEPQAHGKAKRPPGCDCGDPDVNVSETVRKARAALSNGGGK